jgi:hypothetical protein
MLSLYLIMYLSSGDFQLNLEPEFQMPLLSPVADCMSHDLLWPSFSCPYGNKKLVYAAECNISEN